jgi:hypothetical protein
MAEDPGRRNLLDLIGAFEAARNGAAGPWCDRAAARVLAPGGLALFHGLVRDADMVDFDFDDGPAGEP